MTTIKERMSSATFMIFLFLSEIRFSHVNCQQVDNTGSIIGIGHNIQGQLHEKRVRGELHNVKLHRDGIEEGKLSPSSQQIQPQTWRAVSSSISFGGQLASPASGDAQNFKEYRNDANLRFHGNIAENNHQQQRQIPQKFPVFPQRNQKERHSLTTSSSPVTLRPKIIPTDSSNLPTRRYWRGKVNEDNDFLPGPYSTQKTPSKYGFNESRTITTSSSPSPIKYSGRIREPLAALEKEQKLSELRNKQRIEQTAFKITSNMNKNNDSIAEETIRDRVHRKPYAQLVKRSEAVQKNLTFSGQVNSRPTITNLKNLLKNSGGLSLSEILQQKNLSLEDLLKGKQNALLAIQTSTTTAPSTTASTAISTRYTKPPRRIPLSYLSSFATTPTTTVTSSVVSTDNGNTTDVGDSTELVDSEKQQISNTTCIASEEETVSDLTSENNEDKILQNQNTDKKAFPINTSPDASVIDMATIITLRDNPPIRGSLRKHNKSVIFPNRLKFQNNFRSTTSSSVSVSEDINSKTEENIEKETTSLLSETTETGFRMNTERSPNLPTSTVTTRLRTHPTSSTAPTIEKNSTTQRTRQSFRPRGKITSQRQSYKDFTSKESSSSSESGSNEKKNYENTRFSPSLHQRRRSKPKSTPASNYSSNIDDTSSGSSSESSQEETVEKIFKESLPESNLILSPFEDNKPRKVTTLEELFTSTFDNNQERGTSTDRTNILQQAIINDGSDITQKVPLMMINIKTEPEVDDRTDLMELLEDRRAGGRLFKVLAQRNMTLDELIEHRRRGSSELHLAEILRTKLSQSYQQQQKKQEELLQQRSPLLKKSSSNSQEQVDIVTAFENFPHFNLANLKSVKPDEIKTDSQGSSYFTSIIDIEPTDEIYRGQSLQNSIASLPVMEAQQQDNFPSNLAALRSENSINFYHPQARTFSFASYSSSLDDNDDDGVGYDVGTDIDADGNGNNNNENNYFSNHEILSSGGRIITRISPPKDADIDIDPIIRIEEEVAKAHDLLDLELSGHGFKKNTVSIENTRYENGTRSAIVASLAIIIISLLIFLLIFIICRWKQKRKKKLNYLENFNALKTLKLPIISADTATMKHIHDSIEQNNSFASNSTILSESNFPSSSIIFPTTSKNNNNNIFNNNNNNINNNNTRLLNSMDPNSIEIQEYLFDALRKSF